MRGSAAVFASTWFPAKSAMEISSPELSGSVDDHGESGAAAELESGTLPGLDEMRGNTDAHAEELVRRFRKAPKPMYYSPEFLTAKWSEYLASRELAEEMEMELDEELQVVLVIKREGGRRRIIRRIPADEVIRLAELVRSGRQQLLDRVI